MNVLESLRRPSRRLAVVGFAATLLLTAACGQGQGATGGTEQQAEPTTEQKTAGQAASPAAVSQLREPENTEQLAQLEGDITVDGSSTVYPITAAAAEEFGQYAQDVRATVGVSGTGGGFERFCAGETDISNASRPIRDTEIEACQQNNIEFIELPVAYDGIAVVVNPQNDFLDEITVEELRTMWEPAAEGQITTWNQVNPEWPNQPLKLCGPGTDSGTFEYFTEAIVGEAQASRGDYQASEDDNVLVTCVGGDPNALGYFGYSYYNENSERLKAVSIVPEGGGEAVMPSLETIQSGAYQPLSRPLFIYVKDSSAEESHIQEFIDFYLKDTFTPLIESREVGYVALPQQYYDAAIQRFEQRVTGTEWPQGAEVGATLDRYIQ